MKSIAKDPLIMPKWCNVCESDELADLRVSFHVDRLHTRF